MKIQKIIRQIRSILSGAARIHFSQYGEDVYLHKKFRQSDFDQYYIDVGAHHPYHLSNTAYLWTLGWKGTNVDASKTAIETFNKVRPGDLNIHAAVVSEATQKHKKSITFYSNKDVDNCATCDPQIAAQRNLKHTSVVDCITLTDVIKNTQSKFGNKFGLLNIDIEGLDEEAVSDIHLWPVKPTIIMIEIYGNDIIEILTSSTHETLKASGYTFTQRISHTAIYERV